jgi:uncharacterized membrane protein YgcG
MLNVVALAGLAAVAVPTATAEPAPQNAGQTQTEDVLYLEDGRVFHGQIVSEDATEVLFKYVDESSNITTTLSFRTDQINKIERDVPVKAAEPVVQPKRATVEDAAKPEARRTYGARRGHREDENLPLLYVVPMKGQMGTDINPDVYKKMLDDIRQHDPDVIVIEMECLDTEERLYSRIGKEEKGFDGGQFLDMYREITDVFHDELRDRQQVLWIHDSEGISSVLAMAWTNTDKGRHLLMTPSARLGGLAGSAANFLRVQNDENTLGKYREAYMAWLKGFAEYGAVDLEVIDAMVRPEYPLSASWRGRDVKWTLDTEGEYTLDDSDARTVNFTAKNAEDFCISHGTAETIDDVALMMRMREFRVAEGAAEEIFEDYKEDWRQAYEACKQSFLDYNKYMGWANGEDAAKYLGRAKRELEKIVVAIDRYQAVEIRLLAEFGQAASRFNIITQIEILKERLRAMRQQRGGTGASGGASGGRGPAGGSGGGGRGRGRGGGYGS